MPLAGCPATRTSPDVGEWSRLSTCMSVDLPLPLRPVIASRSPARTSRETSSSAVEVVLRVLYVLPTPWADRSSSFMAFPFS